MLPDILSWGMVASPSWIAPAYSIIRADRSKTPADVSTGALDAINQSGWWKPFLSLPNNEHHITAAPCFVNGKVNFGLTRLHRGKITWSGAAL